MGTSIRFTKDPLTLSKLKFGSGLQIPHISNSTKFQRARRSPHPLMDKIEINQNIFIEISSPGYDLTILPIEMNWDFLALLRNGPLLKYG